MRIFLLMFLLTFAGNIFSEETLLQLKEKCTMFISNIDPTETEREKVFRYLRTHVTQRMQDFNETENAALDTVALDWFWDNFSSVRAKEQGAMFFICALFLYYQQRDFALPAFVRKDLTPQKVVEFVSWIDRQVNP